MGECWIEAVLLVEVRPNILGLFRFDREPFCWNSVNLVSRITMGESGFRLRVRTNERRVRA